MSRLQNERSPSKSEAGSLIRANTSAACQAASQFQPLNTPTANASFTATLNTSRRHQWHSDQTSGPRKTLLHLRRNTSRSQPGHFSLIQELFHNLPPTARIFDRITTRPGIQNHARRTQVQPPDPQTINRNPSLAFGKNKQQPRKLSNTVTRCLDVVIVRARRPAPGFP